MSEETKNYAVAAPTLTAKWIWYFDRPTDWEDTYRCGWECSNCKRGSSWIYKEKARPDIMELLKEDYDERTIYCPVCGAKMGNVR